MRAEARRIGRLWAWGLSVLAGLLLYTVAGAAPAQTTNGVLRHRFRQTLVIEMLDGEGKIKETKTEVKEVVPIDGRYLFGRVMSRDGKPLTPTEERSEARRLERFREAIRDGKRPKGEDDSFDFLTDDFAGFREGVAQEGFEVKKLRTEARKGRDCALLAFSSRSDSSPAGGSTPTKVEDRPGKRSPDAREKKEFEKEFIRSVQGRIWVDQEEGQPAQLEVRLARPIRMSWCMVSIKKFDLDVDFERLEPKVWLAVETKALINIKAFLFLNYNMRVKLVRDQFALMSAESASLETRESGQK